MAPVLKYGLIAAAGMMTWILGEYALGLHTTRLDIGDYTSRGTEVILAVVLWRLLHAKLHSANRSWLPVWAGLLDGTIASLVASAGLYVFLAFYLYYLNPEYADVNLEWQVAQMRNAGKPEQEIRLLAGGFRWSLSPVGLPMTVFAHYLSVGIVLSPLFTLWLNWRRKEPVHPG